MRSTTTQFSTVVSSKLWIEESFQNTCKLITANQSLAIQQPCGSAHVMTQVMQAGHCSWFSQLNLCLIYRCGEQTACNRQFEYEELPKKLLLQLGRWTATGTKTHSEVKISPQIDVSWKTKIIVNSARSPKSLFGLYHHY